MGFEFEYTATITVTEEDLKKIAENVKTELIDVCCKEAKSFIRDGDYSEREREALMNHIFDIAQEVECMILFDKEKGE